MENEAFGLLSQWMGLLRNVCSDGFGGELFMGPRMMTSGSLRGGSIM
jgi:hypothetical protein